VGPINLGLHAASLSLPLARLRIRMRELPGHQNAEGQVSPVDPWGHLDPLGLLLPQPFRHDRRAWAGNEMTSDMRPLPASTGDIHDHAMMSLDHGPSGRFLADHDPPVEILTECQPYNPGPEADLSEKARRVSGIHADQVGHPD
jgi:hypothetical protein